MNYNPYISVVVPVFNSGKAIEPLVESLLCQDYPRDSFEIIMVDNNSNDTTKDIIRNYPVVLLEENTLQSSYSARNKGIEHAKGELIAFTDSDCRADRSWLREGAAKMIADGADMVAGRISFIFSFNAGASELYDSLFNLQNEILVKSRKCSTTCNLLVKKKLFDRIGAFPRGAFTGGDIQWTGNAVKKGARLVFCEAMVVHHPARTFKELMEKQFRVGKGFTAIWRNQNKSMPARLWQFLRLLLPKRGVAIRKRILEQNKQEFLPQWPQIWFVSYMAHLAAAAGVVKSLITDMVKRS